MSLLNSARPKTFFFYFTEPCIVSLKLLCQHNLHHDRNVHRLACYTVTPHFIKPAAGIHSQLLWHLWYKSTILHHILHTDLIDPVVFYLSVLFQIHFKKLFFGNFYLMIDRSIPPACVRVIVFDCYSVHHEDGNNKAFLPTVPVQISCRCFFFRWLHIVSPSWSVKSQTWVVWSASFELPLLRDKDNLLCRNYWGLGMIHLSVLPPFFGHLCRYEKELSQIQWFQI